MNAQIEGRVAIVTGGSSGIGFETLRLLLGEGAKVAFCGRDPDRLASAGRRCKTTIRRARFSLTAAMFCRKRRWQPSPRRWRRALAAPIC